MNIKTNLSTHLAGLALLTALTASPAAEPKIVRRELGARHNVAWNELTGVVPLGNGEFCFGAGATGLQTFGNDEAWVGDFARRDGHETRYKLIGEQRAELSRKVDDTTYSAGLSWSAGAKLASQLGYNGLQWPKSVGPEGRSAPWGSNQVLLWKQPHPIFFAELDYRLHPNRGPHRHPAGVGRMNSCRPKSAHP